MEVLVGKISDQSQNSHTTQAEQILSRIRCYTTEGLFLKQANALSKAIFQKIR